MATIAAVKEKRVSGKVLFKWSLLTPLIGLFLFLLPVLVLQIYFALNAWTVYLSSWWEAEFVGLEQFAEVLTDTRFLQSILRSFVFAGFSTLGCFLVGFGLALLMYRPFKGHGFFYAFFILPMLTVPVVLAYTFEMLLYQKGPINGILSMLLGTDINIIWLSDPNVAVVTIILLEIWNWTPFAFIILLAGLSALPHELTEAAQNLGASRWRIFWEIQLPLLRPVIFLAIILRFLEAMGEFPKTWGLLQGGPGSATESIPIYLYLTTWEFFHISKGAAMSYVVMVMMVIIVLLAIGLLRREKLALDKMYHTTGEPA
ncbi:carbohydrate ABC transporter permease [Candidatus Entotheonella palauensis]|nr:sugar ABC transporter permease [Candidatus Entotheonella palauensis]